MRERPQGGVTSILDDVAHASAPHRLPRPPGWLVAGAATALIALAAGSATLGVVVVTAVLVVHAAVIDARTSRIPNRLVLRGVASVASGVALSPWLDDRSLGSAAGRAGWGLALCGAPLLLVLWVLRPTAVGGGDWKLLAVLGAAVGLASPVAAVVMTFVACAVQVVASVVRRTPVMPFAPSLAIGFAAALATIPTLASLLGGTS